MIVHTEVSCIPHVAYPWDPAVLRAIHEFDPRVIPVWVTRVYRAVDTGGELVLGRHAIASHVWNPRQPPDMNVYRALMPIRGGPQQRPTQLDLHITRRPKGNGLCGDYVPFGWEVYKLLRRTYDEWSAKERMRYVDEHGEVAQAARARKKAEEEAAYAAKTDSRWLRKHLEQIDQNDLARIAAGGARHEPKPFVHVRQEAAS